MIRALWTSASGMAAQQMNLDVIANNLANVNTAGFKKASLQFQEMMYDTNKSPGASSTDSSTTPTGVQVGYGSKPVATERNFTQGNLQQTGNTFDVAIQGQGFYKVTLPDGTNAYSAGRFVHRQCRRSARHQPGLSRDRRRPDRSRRQPMSRSDRTAPFPPRSIMPRSRSAPSRSPTSRTRKALTASGNNLYQETAASGNAVDGQTPGVNGMGTLAQGYIETSNVQVVEEMVNMIQAQRAYEINSKAIQTSDQMMGMANNLRQG